MRLTRVLRLLVCVVLLLILPLLSLAAPAFPDSNTVILQGDQPSYLLGRHLMYLEDPSGNKTFEEVRGQPSLFTRSERDVLSFDITSSAYWVKVRLRNADDPDSRWLLEFADLMFQYIDIWSVSENGQVHHIETGSMRPRNDALLAVRGHVIELQIPPSGTLDLYIRGATGYPMLFPLTVWQAEAFYQQRADEGVLHGIYIGIVLAMALYNIFVYKSIGEKAYLHYVGYLFVLAVVQCFLNGLIPHHFLPQDPQAGNLIFVLSYSVSALLACFFSLHFLSLKGAEKKFVQLMMLLSIASIVLGAVGAYVAWTMLFQWVSTVAAIGFMFMGSRHAMRGDRAAIYYVAGFGWFLVAAIVFMFCINGYLPFNVFFYYAVEIGVGIEAILLSLAMAQRVKIMKEEKETAQAAQVAAHHELQKAHGELQQQHEDMKLAQSQLIQQEKMANLGLLSAGIAHEIKNPISFMTLSNQTLESRLHDLQDFISELMSGDADPELTEAFAQRFEGLYSQTDLIKEGSQRVQAIIAGMRSASRRDEIAEKQMIDPAEGLLSTVELVKATWKTLVDFDVSDVSRGWRVMGHESALDQVFTNLLVNAAQAIEDRAKAQPYSPRGLIRVSSRREGDRLLISFEDNGSGLSEDSRQKLFTPFFTTKDRERGTGLGMGICLGILEEHAGRLTVESTPGVGSTFTVSLPMAGE